MSSGLLIKNFRPCLLLQHYRLKSEDPPGLAVEVLW